MSDLPFISPHFLSLTSGLLSLPSPSSSSASLPFLLPPLSPAPPPDSAGTILSSSICLPLPPKAQTSCSHLATNLLSCLGSLVNSPPLTMETLTGSSLHRFDKDSFSCVVRFNGKVVSVCGVIQAWTINPPFPLAYRCEFFFLVLDVLYTAHGGGWGYSASSVEAIRFSPDMDVLIGGFGLYGGRGTYNAEIKV